MRQNTRDEHKGREREALVEHNQAVEIQMGVEKIWKKQEGSAGVKRSSLISVINCHIICIKLSD